MQQRFDLVFLRAGQVVVGGHPLQEEMLADDLPRDKARLFGLCFSSSFSDFDSLEFPDFEPLPFCGQK